MPASDRSWTQLLGSGDGQPQVLGAADLPSLAKYIKSNGCKNIFIMAGAGISTSAGIPDFRSPETGLYHNLARLNLPHPQAVFEIRFFRKNPVPFYTLAHELAPGRFRPTPTHSFIRLLAEKGLLHTCYTQNIDTLERRAGVPSGKIIEAHGSFATQHCIDCGASYPDDKIKEHIKEQKIPHCDRSGCEGLVKPDIVFFGEALPAVFHRGIRQLNDADLLIVMGTSLTVHPFAGLVDLVPEDCPRVLMNMDEVGDFDRGDDLIFLGKCDEIVRDLCKELGWEEDLDRLWAETAGSVEQTLVDLADQGQSEKKEETASAGEAPADVEGAGKAETPSEDNGLDKAKAEVEKLAEELEKAFQISEGGSPKERADVSSVGEVAKDDDAPSGGKL